MLPVQVPRAACQRLAGQHWKRRAQSQGHLPGASGRLSECPPSSSKGCVLRAGAPPQRASPAELPPPGPGHGLKLSMPTALFILTVSALDIQSAVAITSMPPINPGATESQLPSRAPPHHPLSVSLVALGTSCQRNRCPSFHDWVVPLCTVFKVRPHRSMCQCFFPFQG